ncbi:MAG: hypothetical protein P9M05_04470 [Candidatus Stygibacter australis]|nr:hypothetical protein [Candidatus Stygibacter australis]
MIKNNAVIHNKKTFILVLFLFSLLTPLISSPITQEPVYFIDNDIDTFTNVITQDDQIFALGGNWGKLYFYSFDQELHLKLKKKVSDNYYKTLMIPYKEGFLIKTAKHQTSRILYISKKGKVIDSMKVEGSIEDCCIDNDQILLVICRDRKFLIAKINEKFELYFEMLLSDSIESSYTMTTKLFMTGKYNYLLTLSNSASIYTFARIYTFDKMWNFIDKKMIAECDRNCNYQFNMWDEQIIMYPGKAFWLTNPKNYIDYEGQPLKDQVNYLDLEGNLLQAVDIPRYRGFSSELVSKENIYIQQSEPLKTLYLVSSMGDIVREVNFDFTFSMKDHALLSADKYLFAGNYAQCKYWENHGLLLLSQSPDESLSLFPLTKDALALESAFEADNTEALSELIDKWYQSGIKPKKRFCRKWEKEAYALYQMIFPEMYKKNSRNFNPQNGNPYYDPEYILISNHVSIEVSESLYYPSYSSLERGLMSTIQWSYKPTEIKHDIFDFRPEIPLDLKAIYSTDEISRSLLGFFALSKKDKLNSQRKKFLNEYLLVQIQNGMGYEPYIYGYYDYTRIIFDRKYHKAIIRSKHGGRYQCVKEKGVWRRSKGSRDF